jgi:hypothetical protein
MDRAFSKRNQMQGEETFVHMDGRFYLVAFTASPIRDDQVETIGISSEVRGTSAKKRALAELANTSAVSMRSYVRRWTQSSRWMNGSGSSSPPVDQSDFATRHHEQ